MFNEQNIKDFCKKGLELKKFDKENKTSFVENVVNAPNTQQQFDNEFLFSAFSYFFVDAVKKMIEENELNTKNLNFTDGKFVAEYEKVTPKMIEKFAISTIPALNEIETVLVPELEQDVLKKIVISANNFNVGGKQVLETFAASNQSFDVFCNMMLENSGKQERIRTTKLPEKQGRKIEKLSKTHIQEDLLTK